MMKENLKKILIEVPTIVVGVLIALAVNEWSINRERDSLKENIYAAIQEELEFNRKAIQTAYEYHVPLLENLLNGKHKIASVPISKTGIKVLSEGTVRKFLVELTEQYSKAPDPSMIVKKQSDSSFRATLKEDILRILIENDTLKIYGEGNIQLRPAHIRNNAWKIAQAAQIAPYMDFKIIATMSELDKIHSAYDKTIDAMLNLLYEGKGHVIPPLQDVVFFEKQLLGMYSELDTLLRGR